MMGLVETWLLFLSSSGHIILLQGEWGFGYGSWGNFFGGGEFVRILASGAATAKGDEGVESRRPEVGKPDRATLPATSTLVE